METLAKVEHSHGSIVDTRGNQGQHGEKQQDYLNSYMHVQMQSKKYFCEPFLKYFSIVLISVTLLLGSRFY